MAAPITSPPLPSPPLPSDMDHHQMKFWPWACIRDAEAFLRAQTAARPRRWDVSTTLENHEIRLARYRELTAEAELAKHHFVASMGSTIRILKRSAKLYPEIGPLCDAAKHFFTEGKNLRDMIEHADEYFEGKGRKQEEFVREAPHLLTDLPGVRPGIADATSLIIDNTGHWLGGRLCVEIVINELRPILEKINTIDAPVSRLQAMMPARQNDGRGPD